MHENENRLEELLDKYTRDELSEPEFKELFELIKAPTNDPALKKILEHEMGKADFIRMDKGQLDVMLGNIIRRTKDNKNVDAHVKELFNWRKIAAAVALVVLSTSAYFLFSNRQHKTELVKTNIPVIHDVKAPKVARATLMLEDGTIVYLDSVQKGKLAMQGNVNVVKMPDGQIVYTQESATGIQEIKYNTIINPRGSTVATLTLIDGTKVWLNAESSLKYFTSVGSNERKVEITGEAYFEVAHNKAIPFTVKDVIKDVEVKVLGTHFNVKTYADEAITKVTLIEGSVKIINRNHIQILSPGQQAQADTDRIGLDRNPDIDEVMSWKNGWFQFNSEDIESIMRQIGRWYNVEVVYQREVSKETFSGIVSRNSNVSQVLKVMEQAGIKFTIEGRKITVIP